MKTGRLSGLFTTFICMVFVFMCVPTIVHADTGPKPSVQITFEGLGKELCYGTLLSKTESTGPATVWDGTEGDAKHNENYSYVDLDYETWKKFVEYEDVDGYYFLQEAWKINGTKELNWAYYPPNKFKILLYFPESDTFAVSGIYERYAFDSYFTVNMEGFDIADVTYPLDEGTTDITAEKSYDYTWEMISLGARIVITILVEIGIALLFGFRAKKHLLLITGVNVITQVILNVLLNVINYNAGHMAFVIYYILFEMIVFVIEAIIFYHVLNKPSEKVRYKWLTVAYALVSNVASFVVGFAIAKYMPGIF